MNCHNQVCDYTLGFHIDHKCQLRKKLHQEVNFEKTNFLISPLRKEFSSEYSLFSCVTQFCLNFKIRQSYEHFPNVKESVSHIKTVIK